MKKTSKTSGQSCQSQEECGVWLDTVTLKGKVKQKHPVRRPISKLLNPSLGGGGYSLAVALNFTQTKVQMPNTKQSSISSFFSPQSRAVQNQRAASELVNRDAPSASSSNTPLPVGSRSEPTRRLDPEVLAFLNRENEALVSLSGGGKITRQDTESERDWYEDRGLETETGIRRRPYESSSPLAGSQSCSRDVPVTTTTTKPRNQRMPYDLLTPRDSNTSPFSLTHQERLRTNTNLQDTDLFCQEGFRVCQGAGEERRSTQNPRRSRQEDEEEKENWSIKPNPALLPPSPLSPNRRPPPPLGNHTPYTQTAPRSAPPLKRARGSDDHLRGLSSSPCKKPRTPGSPLKTAPWREAECRESRTPGSPLKTAPWREAEQDSSLDMLFTQDSEGYRVISHRHRGLRSPVKDLRDHRTMKTSVDHQEIEEEEEEEMLFTQDSQGNMVIRH